MQKIISSNFTNIFTGLDYPYIYIQGDSQRGVRFITYTYTQYSSMSYDAQISQTECYGFHILFHPTDIYYGYYSSFAVTYPQANIRDHKIRDFFDNSQRDCVIMQHVFNYQHRRNFLSSNYYYPDIEIKIMQSYAEQTKFRYLQSLTQVYVGEIIRKKAERQR